MFTMTHGSAVAAPSHRGTSGALSPAAPTLDAAIRRVIHGYDDTRGRVDLLAMETGIEAKDLYRFSTSPDNKSGEFRQLPARLIPTLTNATRRYDIISHLAMACGGVFVLLPTVHEGDSECRRLLPEMIRETAEAQIALAESLGPDGVITETEARRIEAEGHQAIAVIHQAIVAAKRQAVRGERKPLGRASGKGGR